jgi:hypothetical protein
MGKFERKAKQETAGILEVGVAILIVENWQTRGMLDLFFWVIFLSLVVLHAVA